MKTIKRFDCYLINKNGVVFSKITGKELKPFLRKGYLCVCLYNFGIKCTIYVHRLVAETYIDNPRNKPCIDHIDGNPFNNHVDNLRWVNLAERDGFNNSIIVRCCK